MRKLCFVKHKSFQRKMKYLPLSLVSKIQREEEEFEDQIPDLPEDTKSSHQKDYLKFLLPKGDMLGTERRCKKVRSIKLLLGLSKKT